MRILLDPGHGGSDPGAIGANDCCEELINLKIANRARSLLENYHHIEMSRLYGQLTIDQELTLAARVKMAEDSDIFISVHCNAARNPKARGTEVFYYPGSEKGKALAQKVLDSILKYVPIITGKPIINRGVKEGNFYVLRNTKCPAILIECDFITNPEMADLLTSPRGEIAYACAIALALL